MPSEEWEATAGVGHDQLHAAQTSEGDRVQAWGAAGSDVSARCP